MSRLVFFAAAATIVMASAAQAQVLTVALKPMAAAPVEQQATSVLKGGVVCIKQGPLTASAMRRAFTAGDSDTRLREELTKAGVVVNASGSASVEVAGVAREAEELEVFLRQKLLEGRSIIGVYPPGEAIRREYEASRQRSSGG